MADLPQQSETPAEGLPQNGMDSDRRGERRKGVAADSPQSGAVVGERA